MESFEIPDSVHNLFLNVSLKTLKIMSKNMVEDEKCENDKDTYELGTNLQKYLGVWIVCLLSIVGILLNILCIRASISKKAPKNLFNILLLNLLSWDTIFLILNIARKMEILEKGKSGNDYYCSDENVGMAKVLIPFWNIALAQSVFATLIMSIERYICINHEETYLKYIQIDKRRSTLFLKWILPAIVLVFLVHIPEFVGQNTDVRTIINKGIMTQDSCLRDDSTANNVEVYFKAFVKLVIDGLCPLICLLYCNTKTFLKVRTNFRKSFRISENIEIRPRSNSQQKAEEDKKKLLRMIEHKLAKIMIGIVSVFILCQIPYLVVTAIQSVEITNWLHAGKNSTCGIYSPDTVIMEPIVHLMITINSSVNVIFYCFFDSSYRDIIFPCVKNNQDKQKEKSDQSQEENKEEHTNEQHALVNENPQ